MSGHVWRCPGTPTGCPPPRATLGSTVDSGTLNSIHTIPRLSQKGHAGRGCAGPWESRGALCTALPCTQTAGAPTLLQAEAGLTKLTVLAKFPGPTEFQGKQLLMCMTKSKQQLRARMRVRPKQVSCGLAAQHLDLAPVRLSSTQYRHSCSRMAPKQPPHTIPHGVSGTLRFTNKLTDPLQGPGQCPLASQKLGDSADRSHITAPPDLESAAITDGERVSGTAVFTT